MLPTFYQELRFDLRDFSNSGYGTASGTTAPSDASCSPQVAPPRAERSAILALFAVAPRSTASRIFAASAVQRPDRQKAGTQDP
jgi:hypothetical protein